MIVNNLMFTDTELVNPRARKVLITYVVYTKYEYYTNIIQISKK